MDILPAIDLKDGKSCKASAKVLWIVQKSTQMSLGK